MSYIKNKRDRNEKAILSLWRSLGCYCIQMKREQGYDWTVVSPHRVAIVEIKMPEEVDHLTDSEKKCKAEVEAAGGEYFVVWDDATALEAAGYA
jgi:hypothetical protein